MRTKYLFGLAFALVFIGAVLAFGLDDPDTSVVGFNLRSVGVVLQFAGVLLAAGTAIASVGTTKNKEIGNTNQDGSRTGDAVSTDNLRAITGLVAVVAGIIAVGALTVVTVTLLGGEDNSESTVAITTSAFGIVSAVVTAFLGIKVSAEASAKSAGVAAKRGDEAAVARYEEGVKRSKVDSFNEKVDELLAGRKIDEATAQALRTSSIQGEEVARKQGPSLGGGGA